MHNGNDLLNVIKKAATDAVEASHPSDFYFGKVTSVSPLKILVEQKMTLGTAQLVLTRNVTDFTIDVTTDWITTSYSHTHTIKDTYTGGGSAGTDTHTHHTVGRKPIIIHNALKVGEEVVLLKQKGGQKFLVVDRVVKI